MVDVNSQFFALLTKVGRAKQANADALGLPWKITEMGVGDANDTDPIPSESQTRLINEWRRRPLNQLRVDPANAAVIIAEQIIPADEGGRWIREIGLYDADGDLVAVANCAPSFKPMLSQGSGRTQVVRMNFIVSSTGNITLKIDPAVVLATREYVDQRIMEELYKLDSKQSVRVATTVNIALAGLLTIDGIALVAGDRVLVKNQTVAKDNGLYVAAAGVWKRAEDADTNAEVTSALLVSVEQGATLADTRWQLVTDGVIVLGSTALTFQNVTQGFAPINSPALINPTANTPAQFDNTDKLATTKFVQRALNGYSSFQIISASRDLVTSDIGALLWFNSSGSYNLNLLTPSTLGVPATGASFTVFCTSVGGIVTASGGATIQDQSGGIATSYVMKSGQSAKFVATGIAQWTVLETTAGLGKNADFASVLAPSGYQKHPSGAIDQWGPIPSIPAGGSVLVTFYMTFPNGPVGFSGVGGASGAGIPGVNSQMVSASQVRFWNQSATVATQVGGYRVVGY